MVVYKIKCSKEGCGASYIGKTKRQLGQWIDEHRKGTDSAYHLHELKNPGHKMAYDEVEVIDSANNDRKLQ